MQILIAIVARLFEVLLKVLLIPQINEYVRRKKDEAALKALAKINKEKQDAYQKAPAESANSEFGKLP